MDDQYQRGQYPARGAGKAAAELEATRGGADRADRRELTPHRAQCAVRAEPGEIAWIDFVNWDKSQIGVDLGRCHHKPRSGFPKPLGFAKALFSVSIWPSVVHLQYCSTASTTAAWSWRIRHLPGDLPERATAPGVVALTARKEHLPVVRCLRSASRKARPWARVPRGQPRRRTFIIEQLVPPKETACVDRVAA